MELKVTKELLFSFLNKFRFKEYASFYDFEDLVMYDRFRIRMTELDNRLIKLFSEIENKNFILLSIDVYHNKMIIYKEGLNGKSKKICIYYCQIKNNSKYKGLYLFLKQIEMESQAI